MRPLLAGCHDEGHRKYLWLILFPTGGGLRAAQDMRDTVPALKEMAHLFEVTSLACIEHSRRVHQCGLETQLVH